MNDYSLKYRFLSQIQKCKDLINYGCTFVGIIRKLKPETLTIPQSTVQKIYTITKIKIPHKTHIQCLFFKTVKSNHKSRRCI